MIRIEGEPMTYRFGVIIRFIVVTVVSMHGFSAAAADYRETVKFLRAGSFHKAHSHFSALAEQGDANAQFQLGLMAHLGHGIPQNFLVARKWYERAAKIGEVRSQNNLGIIYRDGLGILPDAVRAYKWFSLGAAQRNEQAIVNLRMLLHDLDKADILTGQRLAQQHHDKLKMSGSNIKSVPLNSKPSSVTIEAQAPKLLEPKVEPRKAAPKTAEISPSIFKILKAIVAPVSAKQPENGIPVSANRPKSSLVNVTKSTTDQTGHGKYFVQLGLFKNPNNVKRIFAKLKDRGIVVIAEKTSLGGKLYEKLRVGPYISKNKAKNMSGLVNGILGIRSLVLYQGTSNQVEAAGLKKDHL